MLNCALCVQLYTWKGIESSKGIFLEYLSASQEQQCTQTTAKRCPTSFSRFISAQMSGVFVAAFNPIENDQNCFVSSFYTNPGFFLIFFRLFKYITNFTTNTYVKKCPSSIRCRESNSWPLERESPPITTRPIVSSSPTWVGYDAWRAITVRRNVGTDAMNIFI